MPEQNRLRGTTRGLAPHGDRASSEFWRHRGVGLVDLTARGRLAVLGMRSDAANRGAASAALRGTREQREGVARIGWPRNAEERRCGRERPSGRSSQQLSDASPNVETAMSQMAARCIDFRGAPRHSREQFSEVTDKLGPGSRFQTKPL